MKRGDIVIVAIQGDYGKPRPAVVIQADVFNETHSSILICPMTSTIMDAPLFRITVAPTEQNGLSAPSQIMADKIVTLRREKIGRRIGSLGENELIRLRRALALMIGIA